MLPGSIYSIAAITIQGSAQVTAAAEGAGQCHGIEASAYSESSNPKSASLTIDSSARVVAKAHGTGTGIGNSRGIYVYSEYGSASLTIRKGARIEANAAGTGFNLGIQVSADYTATGSLSIMDSTVDVQVSSTGSSALAFMPQTIVRIRSTCPSQAAP